ncbi:hypothetical protein [Undibacterium pigrum]|uniref:DUF4230 domain-containing protein n=1 Tax=Undibacterium pigrum TaxID=401470 RepID=A0A318JHS3_9BURK|nr:hypothetical protein [Undibacterium pigrum]PXX46949.1 hypothetical protein DFR42_101525 [Undibacterium pigrum]
MKKTILVLLVAGCTFIAFTLGYFKLQNTHYTQQLTSENITLKNELLGYTRFNDYLTEGKRQLLEQSKLVTAQIVRQEGVTRVIEKKFFGLSSGAIVAISYTAEYSFGYDMRPENYTLVKTSSGIEIKLHRPILLVSPSARDLNYRILSSGMFTDPKSAVIQLYQGIEKEMQINAEKLRADEAVLALCEKKLVLFVHHFLMKQPGVKMVPNISVNYVD